MTWTAAAARWYGVSSVMTNLRLAIAAGIGILALCAVAVWAALQDYVSHPEVANEHIAPVMGPPAGVSQAPAAPVAAVPVVTDAPTPSPAAPTAAAPPPTTSSTARNQSAVQFLQQLDRRRHTPHP
jgi:hypothetical protein